MYASGLKHFYIDEVCALKDGQLVIPLAWIRRSGQLCGDCYLVTVAEVNLSLYLLAKLTSILQGTWRFLDHTVRSVPTHFFERTFLEIAAQSGGVLPWSGMLIEEPNVSISKR